MSNDDPDYELVDRITEQLNHQAVSPGYQASGFLKNLHTRITSRFPNLSEEAGKFETAGDQIYEVAKTVQSLRTGFKSGNSLAIETLREELSTQYEVVKSSISIFRDTMNDLPAEVRTGLSRDLDWARRRLQFFRRLLRRLLYASSGNENYFIQEVNLPRITRIAFENANDSINEPLSFDRVFNGGVSRSVSVANFYSDYDRITEVFTNLFENSLKYHPHVPQLRISIDAHSGLRGVPEPDMKIARQSARAEDYVTFLVRDNGPGIPYRFREKVFEAGFRNPQHEAESDRGGGFGLGYVRLTCGELGGNIRLIFEPKDRNPGAKFVFWIRRFSDYSTADRFFRSHNSL